MNTKQIVSDLKTNRIKIRIFCHIIASELVKNTKLERNLLGRTKFEYVTQELMLERLKPLCEQYEIFIHFNVEKLDASINLATLTLTNIEDVSQTLTYTMHSEDVVINGIANNLQTAGALRKYCFRYLLKDAFLIADASDDLEGKDVIDKKVRSNNNSTQNTSNFITRQIQNNLLINAESLKGFAIKSALKEFCESNYNVSNFVGLPITELANIQKFIDIYQPIDNQILQEA